MGERLPCKQEVTSSTLVFLHSVSKETVMYLENCIQRKSMIKIISYIKTSEV